MIPLRDINPSQRRPIVNVALLVANVLLFLYELMLGDHLQGFLLSAAFVPARAFAPAAAGGGVGYGVASALLSMFLHGGWLHVGGNMLFLWIFGDNVEDRLGHFRYLVFYLLCGYAAALSQALADPTSTVPAIGASGAIAGVLGAYVVLYPRARIVTLIFLGFFIDFIQVPAFVYLPLWFLMQFFSGLASLGARTAGQGGVAWFAHVGGFIAGPVLLYLLGGGRWRRRRPPPRVLDW
jgi:rhomboid family protein